MRNCVPAGWAETTLGEIRVDHSKSIDPRKEPDQTFELYSIPSHAEGRPEVVKGKEVGSAKKTLVPGAVVVSKINPRINRTWVVGSHTPHPKIGSGEWIPFFPVQGIVPEYLAYYMRQNNFRDYLATRVSGVGGSLMRIKPSTLSDYPFVFPSEAHQHRIVEAIEAYLTRLDDAVASLERVQRNLERYRASVLKAAVEGRLVPTEAELARLEGRSYESADVLLERILAERKTRWIEDAVEKARAKGIGNATALLQAEKKYEEPEPPDTTDLPKLPEGWCWATVDQYLENFDGSRIPLRKADRASRQGAYPYYGASGIIDAIDDYLFDGCFLLVGEDGANLLARSTPIAFQAHGKFWVNNHAHVLRTYLDLPLAYPEAFFNGISLAPYVTGTAQPKLTQAMMNRIPIPVAPRHEQHRIIARFEWQLSIAGNVASTCGDGVARGRRLRQSILKWAFEGKLVEQDPSDEPAAVLLERIKAERDAAKTDKPSRRRKRGSAG